MQTQLSNLPKPQNDIEIDFDLIISQIQTQILESQQKIEEEALED